MPKKKNRDKKITFKAMTANLENNDFNEKFQKVTENPKKGFLLATKMCELKHDYDDTDYSQEQARIHFDFYNNECSELHKYRDKEYFDKLTDELKKFNKSTIHQVNQRVYDRIKNRDKSCYNKIAGDLPDDFDLFENRLKGDSRIFYTIVRDMVLIIAVTKIHKDKKRN